MPQCPPSSRPSLRPWVQQIGPGVRQIRQLKVTPLYNISSYLDSLFQAFRQWTTASENKAGKLRETGVPLPNLLALFFSPVFAPFPLSAFPHCQNAWSRLLFERKRREHVCTQAVIYRALVDDVCFQNIPRALARGVLQLFVVFPPALHTASKRPSSLCRVSVTRLKLHIYPFRFFRFKALNIAANLSGAPLSLT